MAPNRFLTGASVAAMFIATALLIVSWSAFAGGHGGESCGTPAQYKTGLELAIARGILLAPRKQNLCEIHAGRRGVVGLICIHEDCGWVCEHPGRPWQGDHGCTRRGRDAAWALQFIGRREEPRMREGFETNCDKKGWRHKVWPCGHASASRSACGWPTSKMAKERIGGGLL